jgi:hypothetical protein
MSADADVKPRRLCNLPIHFFDTPLPRWPTFAINLKQFHPDHKTEAEAVYLTKRANVDTKVVWNRIEEGYRFSNFLFAILNTLQNWQDNAQSRVPVNNPVPPDAPYEALLMRGPHDLPPIYRLPESESGRAEAKRVVDGFVGLAAQLPEKHTGELEHGPHPTPELRIRPNI